MAVPAAVFQPGMLAGRRALVTGGSRGIGTEIVTTLEALGAEARSMGFRHVEAGPLARSSYHAWSHVP